MTQVRRYRPRGMFVADAVAGLVVLAVLGTVIIVAARGTHMASVRLSDSRGATWAAEQALAELQAGRATGADVRVEPLDADPTPQGYAWVRVRTERNGRKAELVGLVPKTSVPTTLPAPGNDAKGGQR